MKTIQMPYSSLATAIGLSYDVYLKREDEHKYGSHKGRSIPFMIKQYVKSEEAIRNFVISSSGNAALAAIQATNQHNKNNPGKEITLKVFIGQKINDKKKKRLENAIDDTRITLEQVDRPKQQAIQLGQEDGTIYLRQSTDELALEGYWELAKELGKIPNLKAVFVPTSSGTTAQALGETFEQMELPIQVHIVQTTSCHPMAEAFDTPENKDFSIAGCIVDHVAHRKNKVIELVKNSSGHGWIVTNEQIKAARQIVQENAKLQISVNSALSIAALKKAVDNGWNWDGPVACLITGQ